MYKNKYLRVEVLVFEPRVSRNRVFTPITVVIEQFFICFDVSGCNQDQVWSTINGMKLSLAVSTSFTVVNQSSKTTCFLCCINTAIHTCLTMTHKTGLQELINFQTANELKEETTQNSDF